MKRTSRVILSIYLVAAILAMSAAPALAVTASAAIDYVAFGDSVASGVRGGVKEVSSDYGYTDDIAGLLKGAGALSSFNEDFCTSGMTASKLAANTAVLSSKTSTGYRLVKNAEIATLTVGANDLLAPLYTYIGTLSSVQLSDAETIKSVLKKVADSVHDGTTAPAIQANIETILQNILNANPKVKIYVMGYYNPLPEVSKLTGVDLNPPLMDFNVYIKKAITNVAAKNKGASINYVETFAAMAANPANYLVMSDIHPTPSGYEVIAGEFWKQIGLLVNTTAIATPTKASVLVNGKSLAFEAYSINDNNYFKLRDLAKAISGTGKQFEVKIDAANRTINLTTCKAYSPVGGELTSPTNTADMAVSLSDWTVCLNGKQISLTAYLINGNNYFKLRDLGTAINFGITYVNSTNTINIDTAVSYTA